MKFSEDSGEAANFVRQAIPAMVKHNIVPNPLNYTLWYSYFSNAFPELNKELDHAIDRYGTCPAKVSESLFIEHINQFSDGSEEKLDAYQRAFSHLVNNLSDSIDSNAKQTTGFSDALKGNISALEGHTLDSEVESVINELNSNANAICEANEKFQGQISAAQQEINALRQELQKSQHDANTDQLTGLCNRRVLEAMFNEFTDEHDDKDNLTVIMIDIDKFKLFNDTHGHLLGDQILQFVGSMLKQECQAPILPVRFGGEEFAILCPSMDVEKSAELAETLRVKLSSVPFTNKKTGKKIPPVTASFGVALRNSTETLSDVVERADKALYAAKDGGRNQVKIA